MTGRHFRCRWLHPGASMTRAGASAINAMLGKMASPLCRRWLLAAPPANGGKGRHERPTVASCIIVPQADGTENADISGVWRWRKSFGFYLSRSRPPVAVQPLLLSTSRVLSGDTDSAVATAMMSIIDGLAVLTRFIFGAAGPRRMRQATDDSGRRLVILLPHDSPKPMATPRQE